MLMNTGKRKLKSAPKIAEPAKMINITKAKKLNLCFVSIWLAAIIPEILLMGNYLCPFKKVDLQETLPSEITLKKRKWLEILNFYFF
jgi:hypothetical protein